MATHSHAARIPHDARLGGPSNVITSHTSLVLRRNQVVLGSLHAGSTSPNPSLHGLPHHILQSHQVDYAGRAIYAPACSDMVGRDGRAISLPKGSDASEEVYAELVTFGIVMWVVVLTKLKESNGISRSSR